MEERQTHKDHEREIRLADWKHFSSTICIMNFKLLIPGCVFLSASLSFYFFFPFSFSVSHNRLQPADSRPSVREDGAVMFLSADKRMNELPAEPLKPRQLPPSSSSWPYPLSALSFVSHYPPVPLCDSFLLFRKWLKSLLEYVMFLYRLRWRFHHSCETFSCENSRVPLIISVDCPVLVSVFECLMRFGLLEDVRVESSGSRSSCCCCSTAWSCLPDH